MRARRYGLLILLLVVGAATLVAGRFFWPRPKSPTVQTRYGPVRGRMDGSIAVYNGVPYAAPPVGMLRWRPPQPPTPWTEPREADAFGPRCAQSDRLDGFTDRVIDGSGMSSAKVWLLKRIRPLLFGGEKSEDCLYLNVRTPRVAFDAKLPVMVWIHGGGYTAGSGTASIYNANGLPKRDVVLVTINYRLNVFGFFAHPDLRTEDPDGAVGNYGFRDQVAALEWVRDNIDAFGGDPGNVTVFGESAGAYSVGNLLTSPLSKGLFHRAIGQSGCGVTIAAHATQPVSTYRAAETVGAEFAAELAAEAANADKPIDALRRLDADTLVAAAFARADFLRHQRPIVDGYSLTESMGLTFARGGAHPVPWMLGWNADEGSIFTDLGQAPIAGLKMNPRDAKEYESLLERVFENPQEARRHFPNAPTLRDAKVRLHGDTRFSGPCWWAAKQHAQAGYPTYLYYFARVPPTDGQTVGAFHASEIAFVFDSHPPLLPRDARDDRLTDQMGAYWTRFAATGDPNGEGAPRWTPFSDATREMLHLDADGAAMRKPDGEARYDYLQRRMDVLNVKAAVALTRAAAMKRIPEGEAGTSATDEDNASAGDDESDGRR